MNYSPSRRAVLQNSATIGSLGAVGGLSGCLGFLGGDSASGKLDSVPGGATTVLYADVAGFLGDDNVKESLNEQLPSYDRLPDSVGDALDKVESQVGLDPQKLNELLTFGEVGNDDSFAAIVWADWSENDLTEAASNRGADLEETSYEGKTIYESGSGESALGVLDDGVYAIGRQSAIEDVIDVRGGNADPVGGKVRSAFEQSRDGYVRFAFEVPSGMVPDDSASQLDLSAFEDVETGYGSIATGSDAAFQVTLSADDSDTAKDVADVVDGGLAMLKDQIQSSSPVGPSGEQLADTVVNAIENTDVSQSGNSVSVKTSGDIGVVVGILGAVVGAFLLGLGDEQQQQTPLASFQFDYDATAQTLTITHDGGDTIRASNLYIRGEAFTNVSGVDMTGPGPWQGETSGNQGGAPAVVAGDDVTVGVDSGYEIRVIWQKGDRSATLAMDTGPTA